MWLFSDMFGLWTYNECTGNVRDSLSVFYDKYVD